MPYIRRGGVYLDSDVEVIKSYDDLLHLPYFIGLESKGYFEAATIGAEKNNKFIGEVLSYYKDRHFIDSNGERRITVMPQIMMDVLQQHYKLNIISSLSDFENKENVINAFEYDWFSPIDSSGKRYVLRTTGNTYSIHHFVSAWVDWKVKLLVLIFGLNSPTRLRLQKYAKRIKKWLKNR